MKKNERNVFYGLKICEEERKKRRLSNDKKKRINQMQVSHCKKYVKCIYQNSLLIVYTTSFIYELQEIAKHECYNS